MSTMRRPRKGFVLLMTLLLIAIAGLSMAAIARRSFTLALETVDAQASLQRRWGAATLRSHVLAQAGEIGPVDTELKLGSLVFQLRLSDENTKVNLNRSHIFGGKTEVIETLDSLRVPRGLVSLSTVASQDAAYQSWGQVFAFERVPADQKPSEWLSDNTKWITCWGSGRLTWTRTSDRVIKTVAMPILGPVDTRRLLDEKHLDPEATLDEILVEIEADPNESQRLLDWFAPGSACYSLWITTETPQGAYCELAIGEQRPEGEMKIERFVW